MTAAAALEEAHEVYWAGFGQEHHRTQDVAELIVGFFRKWGLPDTAEQFAGLLVSEAEPPDA